MLHSFWGMEFDKNNGANGRIPITPDEWARVGVNTDVKAANLIKYLYGGLFVFELDFQS